MPSSLKKLVRARMDATGENYQEALRAVRAAEKYTYRVKFSDADGEWVGTCDEFPSLSWLEATEAGALAGVKKLVADCLEDMKRNGEPLP